MSIATATFIGLLGIITSVQACRNVQIPDFHFYINIPSQYSVTTTPPPSPRPTIHTQIRNDDFQCGSLELPAGYSGSSATRAQYEGRIVGGQDAEEHNWPWMARIVEKSDTEERGICGGTLINEQWVLTAAHCIATMDPNLYQVVLGEHTISIKTGNELRRNISAISINNQFSYNTFNNDIALLKLNEAVTFNEFIRPSCVVPNNTNTDGIEDPTFAGEKCVTLGWGVTSSPMGEVSDVLQELDVTIDPILVCSPITMQNSEDYTAPPVYPGDPKFCATGQSEGSDTCLGDSGSPLLCQHDDGLYYLHGITSYGALRCGKTVPNSDTTLPGVYTKVGSFVDWITQTISNPE